MDNLHPKWTDEKIREEASKFKTKSEFRENNLGAYKAAWKRGILDDVCAHMIDLKTDWTYEMLLSEAKKYSSRGEFSF